MGKKAVRSHIFLLKLELVSMWLNTSIEKGAMLTYWKYHRISPPRGWQKEILPLFKTDAAPNNSFPPLPPHRFARRPFIYCIEEPPSFFLSFFIVQSPVRLLLFVQETGSAEHAFLCCSFALHVPSAAACAPLAMSVSLSRFFSLCCGFYTVVYLKPEKLVLHSPLKKIKHCGAQSGL